jgi:hypothetical protein
MPQMRRLLGRSKIAVFLVIVVFLSVWSLCGDEENIYGFRKQHDKPKPRRPVAAPLPELGTSARDLEYQMKLTPGRDAREAVEGEAGPV